MPEVQEQKPSSEDNKYLIAIVLATLGALVISQSGSNFYLFLFGFSLCLTGFAILT